MKPLKPQSIKRIDWENALQDCVSDRLECTNSDAQAIIEAHQALADRLYGSGVLPMIGAALIDDASIAEEQTK